MAPQKGFLPINKKDIDVDLMKKLYYEDKWDYKRIADYFGLKSKSGIYDRFKKLGLTARTNTDLKTGFKHSDKTKLLISMKVKGMKHTPETIQKMRERFTGSKNPMYGKIPHNYKGGYIRKDGYRVLNIKDKSLLEHRIIWERMNGKLPEGYVIHHINGIKTDNRIENLTLLKKSEHAKLHDNIRGRNKKHQFKKGQFTK